MRNIPNKTDNTSVLPAEDFNSINDEMRTIVTSGSEVIGGPDNQLSKSISNYVGTADYYNEQAGTPDVITLATSNATLQPTLYFDGLRVRFIGSVANSGDPSGVSVTVGTLGLQAIKQFDGSPLTAGSIVANEMTELLFVGALDYFIIASTSNTRMITADTTLIVDGGPNFLTLHNAYESIRNKYILDNVVVTIEIEGAITETLPTVIAHSEGNNIKIVGEASITTDILSIISVSGGAGGFSVEYEITPGGLAGLAIGDYLIIHDTVSSGPDVLKEYGRKHEGIWKVTDAGGGSDFTVTNKFGFAMSDALKTSDLSTAKVTFIKATLNYDATDCLTIKNAPLNSFADIAIINIGGSGGSTLSLENAVIDLDGRPLGVVSETQGAISLTNSKITSKSAAANLAAISDVDAPLKMTSSSINNAESIILNASGEPENTALLMVDSFIGGDDTILIACGNAAGSAVAIGVFSIRSSRMKIKKLVAVANRSLGLNALASQLEVDNIVSADNDIGILLEASSGLYMLNTTGELIVVDNDRGPTEFGLQVATGSNAQVGRQNTNPNFILINKIELSGHIPDHDAQAINGGCITLMGASGSIGRIDATVNSSIILNIAPTAFAFDLNTASFIDVI